MYKIPSITERLKDDTFDEMPAELITLHSNEWKIYFDVHGDITTGYTAFVKSNMYSLFSDVILSSKLAIPEGLTIQVLQRCEDTPNNQYDPKNFPKIHYCKGMYIKKDIDAQYCVIYSMNRTTGRITCHKLDKVYYIDYAKEHDKTNECFYISHDPKYCQEIVMSANDPIQSMLNTIHERDIPTLFNFLL